MGNRKPSRASGPAAQACCAVFRGVETIRRVQQQAAHEAFTHHQDLAKKLEAPCSPTELVAVQAELLRVDVEGAAHDWQQLASAMLEMPRDLLGSTTSAVQMEAGRASRSLSTEAPAGGLTPFFFQVNGAQRAATACSRTPERAAPCPPRAA